MPRAMPSTLKSTPARDGFWMPAEFEAARGLLDAVAGATRQLAAACAARPAGVCRGRGRNRPIRAGERRLPRRSNTRGARSMLPAAVRVVELSSDDAWMRDVGPTFVVNAGGALRGVHWRFNAWGGLYRDFRSDQVVAQKVLEAAGCERYCAPLINEGGAIHVDGQGTVLVTEQCLLKRNRSADPAADRGCAEALPGRELRDLARRGRDRRRDLGSYRQSGLLCASRRGLPDLERRSARSAAPGLQGRLGTADGGARCAWPSDCGCTSCPRRGRST